PLAAGRQPFAVRAELAVAPVAGGDLVDDPAAAGVTDLDPRTVLGAGRDPPAVRADAETVDPGRPFNRTCSAEQSPRRPRHSPRPGTAPSQRPSRLGVGFAPTGLLRSRGGPFMGAGFFRVISTLPLSAFTTRAVSVHNSWADSRFPPGW